MSDIDVCAISVHNDLWLKCISDLIKTLKTIKTLLKFPKVFFELRSLVLLHITVKSLNPGESMLWFE